jgi:hypothetical protein
MMAPHTFILFVRVFEKFLFARAGSVQVRSAFRSEVVASIVEYLLKAFGRRVHGDWLLLGTERWEEQGYLRALARD